MADTPEKPVDSVTSAERPAGFQRSSLVNSSGAVDDGLVRTGKLAGGMRNDIARRLPWYVSDWTDGFQAGKRLKVLTAALYMFCACLAPGIAFGAFFAQHSGNETGVVEYLITQGVCGCIFAIVSGQPLIMLRPTGPITVFLAQLYEISVRLELPFLTVMAWTGISVGTYMIIIAVMDGCALIRFCSRFTQDGFGCFVSIIFIALGVGNIIDKFTLDEKSLLYSPTHQLILTVSTLYVAWNLAGFNKTRFFKAGVRESISDFAVPAAIILATVASHLLSVQLEPLPVPTTFGPTKTGRAWVVDLLPVDHAGKCILVGAISGVPLVLLFFIDQNVTSLLTQHPDHKLRKGAAFHYNFFILGVFNIIMPMFGCPFVTGSLPHSPQFAKALADVAITREGGVEKREIVSVNENRVSPLLVNVLILACLPEIGVLENIPTCVICDGLFLFMGLSGLPGNQFWERLKLIFTEEALYPELTFTKKEVPRTQMHVFTVLQFFFVAVLFGVARSPIAIAFPVFLVASIPFRMLLPKITCGFLTPDMVASLDNAKRKDSEVAVLDQAPQKDVDATAGEKVVAKADEKAEDLYEI